VPNRDRNRDADIAYTWPCTYTENHSLNILVAAYLIDHLLARDRGSRRRLLQQFLYDRARWGWSEFHSPNYAEVTAKALSLLADFAPDAELALAAAMHLDVLALEFANHAVGGYRGVPFVRGAGRQKNNASNSFVPLARLWFGRTTDDREAAGGTFLLHMAVSAYVPPAAAGAMVHDRDARGSYRMRSVATHGPARERLPIESWVTPWFSVSAMLGHGSTYDACYWSISSAASPQLVITSADKRRCLFQHQNVLVTWGAVDWHGKWQRTPADDGLVLATDGTAWVAQQTVGSAQLLAVCGPDQVEDAAGMQAWVSALAGSAADDGSVHWRTDQGRQVRVAAQRVADGWHLRSAQIDDTAARLDSNMLFDSPWLRSVRGSAIVDVRWQGTGWRYDFSDPAQPRRTARDGGVFPALPAQRIAGPHGMALCYVPGGEFVRGSSAVGGRPGEQPQHWIGTDAFYISQTEVTVGQYRAYLDAVPAAARPPDWYWQKWGKTDAHPMTYVTWDEAVAYCAWLSTTTGAHYRLPTETEWEKAARGWDGRRYPWGDTYDGTQSGNRNGTYVPVGSLPGDRSVFGCLDMAGNAWEWCADWFAAYPATAVRNPGGPGTGGERVVRGCGWNFDPDTFRCAFRSGVPPTERSLHIGFRVLRVPAEE
jgi:iron(II)-dependent oxidoreductase